MFRAPPKGKKILYSQFEAREKNNHYSKLRQVKSTINSRLEFHSNQANRRAKKDLQRDEKFTEIERENRLLLERMSNVQSCHKLLPRPMRKKSMNYEARKKQLIEITHANYAFLKRLRAKQPNYKARQWESDWKRNESIMKQIGEYPYKKSNLRTKKLHSDSSASLDSQTCHGRKLTPLMEIVFKKVLKINGVQMLVEIQKRQQKLKINAFNSAKAESFKLQLELQEARELIGGTGDYRKLAKMLVLEKDELGLRQEERTDRSDKNS